MPIISPRHLPLIQPTLTAISFICHCPAFTTPRLFPQHHRHSLTATPNPDIDSRPPPWLPTDISHNPTRALTMPRTTSTSTNHHTRTSPYLDTAHLSKRPTVLHLKAALTPRATVPRAQTMASAHSLDSLAYRDKWAQGRAVSEQDG